jgi:hypothetical protein
MARMALAQLLKSSNLVTNVTVTIVTIVTMLLITLVNIMNIFLKLWGTSTSIQTYSVFSAYSVLNPAYQEEFTTSHKEKKFFLSWRTGFAI